MRDAWHDLKHGIRFWRRSPLFSVFALATIALGVGATTAIFAVVEGVLLRPLPFQEPERLVALWEKNPERGWMFNLSSPANYLDWRERVSSFEDVTAHGGIGGFSLSGQGEPEMLSGVYVTGNFFSVLGAAPEIGRGFSMEETWEGASDVVVLSHGLWQRRFGSDPAAVGRRIVLGASLRTVVGIAPRGFDFPAKGIDLWVPIGWAPKDRAEVWFRRAHFMSPVARLRPEATTASAAYELEAIASRLEREFPETNRSMGAGLTPLHDWITGDTRRPLMVILAAVGLVLLGACANLGNLLLARATTRSREMALRGALGASRARLIRQLLLESALLAAIGGVLAVLIAKIALPLLVSSLPSEIPRTTEVSFGGPVLGFGFLASLATALAFGLVPAIQASRAGLSTTMREGGRGLTGSRSRTPQLLVVSEVALAVVLATGAGLLLRSFLSISSTPKGFDAEDVWTATVSLPFSKYDDPPERERFHADLLERLESLPGVASAAAADHLPLTGVHWTTDFLFEGRPPEQAGIEFSRRLVSPGYFRTMGVPILEGRDFAPSDRATSEPVVVINDAVRRLHFAAEDAVGTRIAFENEEPRRWLTIVGVVGDEKIESLSAPSRPEIFLPLSQEPAGSVRYVFRSAIDP
ncbi:MAG: ABC transporter permease, partial [Vicinamibacteria bacterium]